MGGKIVGAKQRGVGEFRSENHIAMISRTKKSHNPQRLHPSEQEKSLSFRDLNELKRNKNYKAKGKISKLFSEHETKGRTEANW